MCFVCVHACAYVHMYVCAHTNVITKQKIVCIVINVNIFIRAYQYYKVSLIRSNIRVEIQFKNCYLLVCVVMILLEEIEVGTSNSILQYLNDCVYCFNFIWHLQTGKICVILNVGSFGCVRRKIPYAQNSRYVPAMIF